MRYLFIIAGFLFMNSSDAYSQCAIDSSQTNAGIYPDTLPVATAGQLYDVDVTFVMLTDTLGLTIYNYQITSVVGLPVGLNWQCNHWSNGCNYDPSGSLYGCVDISGTPVVPGNFTMTVTVVADVQLAGSQTISFDVPLTVIPGTVSNPGFSMVNASGCAPLTVDFINNNPAQAAYLWDFGNGLQSNQENPPSQTYAIPGTYVVTQTVTPAITPSWYLTEVTVSSIPNNYGGFVDDPDMYFLLYDPLGNEVYDSRPAIDGTFPPVTWSVPNILLQNGNYSIHVWDEDGGLFGGDDDLGVIAFNGNGASGTATGTVGGASGQLIVDYVIFQTPVVPLIATDTIYVYAAPAVPVISANGPLTVCEGDSIWLTINDSVNSVQWYESGSVIPGETNMVLVPITSGSYAATVTTLDGCMSTSLTADVIIHPQPQKPTFFVVGSTFTTGVTGVMLQWYLNGVAIPGASDSTYTASSSGIYQLCASDTNGCMNCSDTLVFVMTSVNDIPQSGFSIYPNPSTGRFTLLFEDANSARKILIADILGKTIYEKIIGPAMYYVHATTLAPGMYMIGVEEKGLVRYSRLLVE